MNTCTCNPPPPPGHWRTLYVRIRDRHAEVLRGPTTYRRYKWLAVAYLCKECYGIYVIRYDQATGELDID